MTKGTKKPNNHAVCTYVTLVTLIYILLLNSYIRHYIHRTYIGNSTLYINRDMMVTTVTKVTLTFAGVQHE